MGSSCSVKYFLKTLVMLFICRLVMCIPISSLRDSSKEVYPASEGISSRLTLTPLVSLKLLMNVALVFILKPRTAAPMYIRLLTLVYTSIESIAALHLSTPHLGYRYVGLVGLVSVGSMVLVWLNEHLTMVGIGSGASIAILIRLLSYVPSVIPMLKPYLGTCPTAIFLLVVALILMFYLSMLVELTSKRITTWFQDSNRKYSSCFYVSLVPVNIFPLVQANMVEKIYTAFGSSFKWIHIQTIRNSIEIVCVPLLHVGLLFYFCVISTRWSVKANNVSACLEKSSAIISSFRPGLRTNTYLNFLYRDVSIAKSLCISLGCAVIRLLYLFDSQIFVLDEPTYIALIAASLVLSEHMEFYVSFIRCIKIFKGLLI